MVTNTKFSFYTTLHSSGKYVGHCTVNDLTAIRDTRDAAYNAVRRRVLCLVRSGLLTMESSEQKKVVNATKPKRVKRVTKKSSVLKNRIAIVLDESGSMDHLRDRLLSELQKTLGTIKENAIRLDQESVVSIYKFSNKVTRLVHGDVRFTYNIHRNSYRPSGSTALYDAVGRAIEDLGKGSNSSDSDTSFLVIVLTDGQENHSFHYNRDTLKGLMDRVQGTDRWSFAFQVPRGGRDLIERMGIPVNNIHEWDQTEAGLTRSSQATNSGLVNYYTARSAGERSVKNFYETDMSKVKIKDVTAVLHDIRHSVKQANVEREEEVRDFCTRKWPNTPFVQGMAFYQLTKKEQKVQDYKKFLIMERGNGAVYAGRHARKLLGLPESGTVKVVPGNHANYEIFVQSTSVNRRLVRGTKLICWPGVPEGDHI